MRHTIWSSEIDYENDWKEFMDEDYPELSDDEKYYAALDINGEYLNDEIDNLDKELDNNIVVFANLGLWNGRHAACKISKSSNLNDIFNYCCGDYVTWYVEDEDVKCDDTHHDGTNHYIFRMLKPGLNEYDFDEVAEESFDLAMEKCTVPIGHYVQEIYGWKEVSA